VVSVHELAEGAVDPPGTHLELVQSREVVDRVTVIRCPKCKGLRSCYPRHEKRQAGICKECKAGTVISAEQFYGFWLEHFTNAEIEEMARAIFG